MHVAVGALHDFTSDICATSWQVEDMMVQINADKEEAEAVRVKVEAEEAVAKEKVGGAAAPFIKETHPRCCRECF